MRNPVCLVAALALLAAAPAHACWDGVSATVGRVTFTLAEPPEGAAEWSPDEARKLATWGRRIDALLPEGGSAQVSVWGAAIHGDVELCGLPPDGRCQTIELAPGRVRLRELFDEVAMLVAATPAEVELALALVARPSTVEAAAAEDARAAELIADRINAGEVELHGFYVAGGFPARNPSAHVVRASDHEGRRLYRVLVGAFLTRRDAEAARAELRALGVDGKIRPLVL